VAGSFGILGVSETEIIGIGMNDDGATPEIFYRDTLYSPGILANGGILASRETDIA
jgi:hypothetical protein